MVSDAEINQAIDDLVERIQDGDRAKAATLLRRWGAILPPKMDAETLLLTVCWMGQAASAWLAPHLGETRDVVGAAVAQTILTGLEAPPSLFETPPPDAAHRRRSSHG